MIASTLAKGNSQEGAELLPESNVVAEQRKGTTNQVCTDVAAVPRAVVEDAGRIPILSKEAITYLLWCSRFHSDSPGPSNGWRICRGPVGRADTRQDAREATRVQYPLLLRVASWRCAFQPLHIEDVLLTASGFLVADEVVPR